MNKFIQKAAHRASSQTQIWPINCSPKHPNEVLSRLGLLLGLGLVSGPSTIQLVDVIFPFQKRTFSQASHGQAAWIPKVLSHPSQAQQKKYLCLFCVVSLFSSIDFVFPVVGLYMVYTRIRCSHVLSLGGTVPLKFLLDVLVLDTNRKNNILHKYIFFMVGKLPFEMFETEHSISYRRIDYRSHDPEANLSSCFEKSMHSFHSCTRIHYKPTHSR